MTHGSFIRFKLQCHSLLSRAASPNRLSSPIPLSPVQVLVSLLCTNGRLLIGSALLAAHCPGVVAFYGCANICITPLAPTKMILPRASPAML